LTFRLVANVSAFVFVFLWFFKAVNLIDHFVQYAPAFETPIFLGLSLVPIWLSRSRVVERTMQQTLDGLAYFTRSPETRHLLNAAKGPLAGVIDALLIFLPVNLVAQSFTADWSVSLPTQWVFLDPDGDGILTAAELEDGIAFISQRVLYAVVATYLCLYMHRARRPPEDFTPEDKNWERPGALPSFWRGMVLRRGLYVLLNLVLDAIACVAAGCQWLKVCGMDPVTVITFGGIGGIAFGLASQSLLSNVISGILILVTRPFVSGDYIESNGVQGYVRRVGWVFTEVETSDGPRVSIPNSALNESMTTNRTLGENRKFKVNIPVRFPEGKFDQCRDLLAGIEQAVQDLADRGGIRDGTVAFTEPPVATLRGLEFTATTDNPLPMVTLEVCCDNAGLGEIDDIQSEVTVEAVSYVQGLGYEVPGLEFQPPPATA